MRLTLGTPELTSEVFGVPVVVGPTPPPWPAPHTASDVDGTYLWADTDRLQYDAGAARVHVTPDLITIDAAEESVRAEHDWLLYATAARALLSFADRFNLHATLVVSPSDEAVAVVGESMAGKSTTTVSLVRRGWRLACDDIVEVRHEASGPVAVPVERPLHLSDDVARALGADPAIGRVLPGRDKRAYAVDGADLVPRPLAAMVLLSVSSDATEVEAFSVSGLDALATVAAYADRYGIGGLPEHRGAHLRWTSELCRQVPVHVVRRPPVGDTTAAVADAVAAVLR